ncbi:MAG: hypothetical protein HY241_17110 [Actinobacteria bacterium]|nr:hypothetical protein [Actinomycetota bacterium]
MVADWDEAVNCPDLGNRVLLHVPVPLPTGPPHRCGSLRVGEQATTREGDRVDVFTSGGALSAFGTGP